MAAGGVSRKRFALGDLFAGENPFGTTLEALRDKVVEGRPVEVRHMPAATGLDQCNVVFIGQAEQGRFKERVGRNLLVCPY